MSYVVARMTPNAQGQLTAPFPTWSLIAGPFGANNLALINVPDADFQMMDGTPAVGPTQKLSVWLTNAGLAAPIVARAVAEFGDLDVTVALDAQSLASLKQRIDRRYREKQGGWNIGVG